MPQYVTVKNAEILVFFVKDKFTRDLQSFVMPHFTFLPIKIVHYFRCVI